MNTVRGKKMSAVASSTGEATVIDKKTYSAMSAAEIDAAIYSKMTEVMDRTINMVMGKGMRDATIGVTID